MWRFRLFGTQVEVDWTFWLTAVLLGPVELARTPQGLAVLALWIAIVFASLLWHEFGHIFFQKRYGAYRSHIRLWSFGGLAIPDGGVGFTRKQHIIISAAGPAAQLLLAGAVWALAKAFPPQNLWQGITAAFLVSINLWWALLNLLPVLPLDGGNIFLHASHGRRALTGQVGFFTAIAAGIFFCYKPIAAGAEIPVFRLLFFGWLAYYNFQFWQQHKLGAGPRWR